MRSFFRWSFSSKFVRGVFIVFVFLLILCVVAAVVTITVVNIRGEQRWHEYEAAAKARGIKLNFDEFIPPHVPEAENYAAVPIFAEMQRATAAGKRQPLDRLEADEFTKRPEFGRPDSGRRTDLASWVRFLNRDGEIGSTALASPDESAAKVLESLKEFDPVLQQLEAAAQRPAICFPVNWEAGDIGAERSHYALINRASLLYSLRLRAHTRVGDGTAALDEVRGLLNLRRALEREPTFIPCLTRLGITGQICDGIWEGLVAGIWNDAQLSMLEQELARIDLARDYRFLLESQRASENRLFDLLVDSHAPGRERLEQAFLEDIGLSRSKLRYLPFLKGWLRGNQWRLNLYFDELLSTVDDARGHVRPTPTYSSALFRFQNIAEKLQYALFDGMGPPLGMIGGRFAYGETLKRQAQIGCGLERYRLREAKYPAALSSLVPHYLPVVPKEVLVDADFHYEVSPQGAFRLYSVALNRKDDGGLTTTKRKGRLFHWARQLDWLWLHAEEPNEVP